MRSNYKSFNLNSSLSHIDDILNDSNTYDESEDIPEIDDLTFKNGKYVNCAAFFIDLRGSTNLIETHGKKSRTLARIYRSYISEIVAIVNSFKTCKEINIVGDCVSAVFAGKVEDSNSPVIEAMEAAAMSNGMMQILNVKYKKKWSEDFEEIKAGIGIALGRALVIKAGFSGSGIKELIYMGDVVNRASKMCGLANKEYNYSVCVTEKVFVSVGTYIANAETGDTYQDWLKEQNHPKHGTVYTASFHRVSMAKWAEENK